MKKVVNKGQEIGIRQAKQNKFYGLKNDENGSKYALYRMDYLQDKYTVFSFHETSYLSGSKALFFVPGMTFKECISFAATHMELYQFDTLKELLLWGVA
jgi:hypothetical protein